MRSCSQDPDRQGVLATGHTACGPARGSSTGSTFADLHLWLPSFLPGFCKLDVDEGTELATERGSWFPFGVVRGDSFAYLPVRPAPEGTGAEYGARAYAPHGNTAATAMAEQIQAGDRNGRYTSPTFGYWPTGSDSLVDSPDATAMRKTRGVVTISWPRQGQGVPIHPSSEE